MRNVVKRSTSKMLLLAVVSVTVFATLSIPAASASSDSGARSAPKTTKVSKKASPTADYRASLTGTEIANGASKGALADTTSAPQLSHKNLKASMRASGAASAGTEGSGAERGSPSANFGPLANFDGMNSDDDGDTYEPNVVGDVGPEYYVQVVYSSIGIFDKDNGNLVGSMWLDEFFDGPTGTKCDMEDDADFEQASVMYDTVHDRWIVVASTWDDPAAGPFYDCIAVSANGDPLTGDWNMYKVDAYPGGDIYPLDEQWGLWNDGLYKSVDLYCDNACPAEYPDFGYVGIQIYGFNLDDLINGSALRWQTTTGTGHQAGGTFDYNSFASPTPATMRVQAGVPPVGRPEYFVGNEYVWGELVAGMDVWRWNVNWNNAASSVLSAVATVRAGSLTGGGRNYFQSREFIPTPGGNPDGLNSAYDYPIGRIQYSNVAGNESLWATQANDSSAAAATARSQARWYRFGINSGTGALANSGGTSATQWQTAPNQGQDFAPDTAVDRWIPALAVDKNGNMAIGYNVANARVANPLVYPSIRYTGREVGDTANTLKTPEQTLVTGTGWEIGSVDGVAVTDWTSSATMILDPDGCTFWFTGEYLTAQPTNVDDNQWKTRIGSMAFPSCSPSLLATGLTAKGHGSGANGTLTATLKATGTGSGVFDKTVDFTLGGNPVGSATTDDYGVATLTGVDVSAYASGTVSGEVGASYAGDADTYATSSATGDLLVNGGTAQTITFGSLADKTFGDADFSVSASSDSSLPISFSASGKCSVSGSNVHIKGAGSCTITASQEGDGTYAAAADVDQTFTIAKGTQTITWVTTLPLTDNLAGNNKTVKATSNTGRQVFFSTTTPGTCTSRPNGLDNSARIDSTHTGVCTVRATVPGDTDYLAATNDQSFNIAANTQTCTIGGQASRRIDQGQPLATPVTCTSGLPASTFAVTSSSINPANIAAAPSTIAMQPSASFSVTAGAQGGAGANRTETVTCGACGGAGIIVGNTVTISGASNANYNRTAVVTAKTATTITVGTGNTQVGVFAGTATIAISGASEVGTTVTVNTAAAHGLTNGTAITVSGTTPSGYNGSFTIATTPLGQGAAQATAATLTYTNPTSGLSASTVAGSVAPANAGASESGNTVTLTTTAAHTFTVGESITVSGVADSGYNGTFTTIAPTGGTTVTYTNPTSGLAPSGGGTVARTGAACTVGGVPGAETLTLLHVGTCTTTATQTGSADFSAAPPVVKVFTITAGQDTITFSPTTAQTGPATFVVTASLNPAVAGTVYGLSPGTVTSTTPGVCTVGATTPGTGTSTVTVTPVSSGNCILSAAGHGATTDWVARAATTQTIVINKANQTITFAPIADKSTNDADFDPGATASSGLSVTYTATGDCSIVANQVHIDNAGSCTVTAHQAGNGLYNAATNVSQTFAINKVSQTISFDPIADKAAGDADFDPGATASSGLAVDYTATGDCSIVANQVHLLNSGSCTVTAHQAGNATYEAAPDVSQSFNITSLGQTITFAPLANKAEDDPDFTVSASASSGLDVDFTASGDCTVTGDPNTATVSITGPGSCTITAHQPGNGSYDPAPDVARSFTILAYQTINFAALPNKTFGAADFAISATATSGLTVTFTATGQCTVVAGPKIHLTGAGSCSVTAHQAGNGSYFAAPDVTRTFTINARPTTTVIQKYTPKTVASGGSVTATAKVTVNGVKKTFPSGTVQFKVGTTVLGTATINAKGIAKTTFTAALAPGTYKLIATYVASGNDATSSSSATKNNLKVT